MADHETTGLNRTFAGLLSDLEDEEVRLAGEQSRLSKELQEVEGELERIAAVKRAIHGGASPQAPKRAPRPYTRTDRERAQGRHEQAMAFVSALDNGATFDARALSEHLGTDGRGVGPLVGRMVREGVIEIVEGEESSTGHRVYRRA